MIVCVGYNCFSTVYFWLVKLHPNYYIWQLFDYIYILRKVNLDFSIFNSKSESEWSSVLDLSFTSSHKWRLLMLKWFNCTLMSFLWNVNYWLSQPFKFEYHLHYRLVSEVSCIFRQLIQFLSKNTTRLNFCVKLYYALKTSSWLHTAGTILQHNFFVIFVYFFLNCFMPSKYYKSKMETWHIAAKK